MMRLTLALSCLPCLFAADVTTYATKQWDWDEAKFQLKTPLRELAETISGVSALGHNCHPC